MTSCFLKKRFVAFIPEPFTPLLFSAKTKPVSTSRQNRWPFALVYIAQSMRQLQEFRDTKRLGKLAGTSGLPDLLQQYRWDEAQTPTGLNNGRVAKIKRFAQAISIRNLETYR